jgi:hypothetical protein
MICIKHMPVPGVIQVTGITGLKAPGKLYPEYNTETRPSGSRIGSSLVAAGGRPE